MLTITFPDGWKSGDVPESDAQLLWAELQAMGVAPVSFDPTYPATGGTATGQIVQVTDENSRDLARALDHVRNATGPESLAEFEQMIGRNLALLGVRDRLLDQLNFSPLTYRLRSWFLAGEGVTFFSYTGLYEAGDRLVRSGGEDGALRVTEVAKKPTPAKDGVLVVEHWERH